LPNQLPIALLNALEKLDHFDREAFCTIHEAGIQEVSVHMNVDKLSLSGDKWPDQISNPPFEISGKVPWAEEAYYLSARPSFTMDPLFHAGTYYVQEASGMFLAYAINKTTNISTHLKILDLCAAPGGKSTIVQSLISKNSLLVSNEVIKTRVPVLYQNMTKWGLINGIISNNDPSHFRKLPGFFDIVIVDAPCSGSGLFRKDPEAALAWSPDSVNVCSHRQQRILGDIWDCLKEDGLLIYSTCSYSKEENEDIVDMLCKQYPCESIDLNPDPEWNIIETKSDQSAAFGYRFYPYKLKGEGFFLSVIRKKQSAGSVYSSKSSRFQNRLDKKTEIQIKPWIYENALDFVQIGDQIHAMPQGMHNDFEILKESLYLKKAGIRLGKPGDKEWIPDHELALSTILNNNYPSIDLSEEDALRYLRSETLEIIQKYKGWHVIRFQKQRIGWVKLLGNRINNYYPKSWRIRR